MPHLTPIFAVITPLEIGVVLVVAVLLFGADRIPKLARSIGHAKKEFEAAQRGETSPSASAPPTSATQSGQSTPPPAPPQS